MAVPGTDGRTFEAQAHISKGNCFSTVLGEGDGSKHSWGGRFGEGFKPMVFCFLRVRQGLWLMGHMEEGGGRFVKDGERMN